MKQLVVVLLFINGLYYSLSAQNLAPQTRRTPLTSDLFNGMPIVRPASVVQGDVYRNTHWNIASFKLYNSAEALEGYYMRYNIHADEFEIRTQQGIKGLQGTRVKSYVMRDSLIGNGYSFINAKDYKIEGTPLAGFFEILADGPAMLVKRYYLIVKAPDYNPALSSGSRDTKIIKKTELFYLMGQEAFKIKGKKKMLASFGNKATEMETYIKENSLSISEEEGLRKIFNHYNELTSKN